MSKTSAFSLSLLLLIAASTHAIEFTTATPNIDDLSKILGLKLSKTLLSEKIVGTSYEIKPEWREYDLKDPTRITSASLMEPNGNWFQGTIATHHLPVTVYRYPTTNLIGVIFGNGMKMERRFNQRTSGAVVSDIPRINGEGELVLFSVYETSSNSTADATTVTQCLVLTLTKK